MMAVESLRRIADGQVQAIEHTAKLVEDHWMTFLVD
jgi:hypothetical protein